MHRCQQARTRIHIAAEDSREMGPNSSWFTFPIRCRDKICCNRIGNACSILGYCKMSTVLSRIATFSCHNRPQPLTLNLKHTLLDEIENPRQQRLKACIMGYNFTVQWTKGSEHHAPDASSRHPNNDPQCEDTIAEHDYQLQPEASISEIWALSSTDTTLPTRLQELRDRAVKDPEYQELYSIILNGFPAHRHQLPETCKRFWGVKEHLSIDNGLIIYSCHLLIPRAMRPQVLADFHKAHQGIVRTKQLARLTIYCPGTDNDIDNVITSCQLCQDHLPSNCKEPINLKPKPLHPFQEVAADFCAYRGKQFLIIVNCHTDWPEIIPMGTNTKTHHLIATIRSAFCRTAIPNILWSDGGPQFTAKAFHTFTVQWGFTHQTSSPRYPQRNGNSKVYEKDT